MSSNRRRQTRLKIEGARIAVQIYPVMPFLGPSYEARLVNLSEGGMGIVLGRADLGRRLVRNSKLSVHVHLPGQPLHACHGVVSHNDRVDASENFVGIRFTRVPYGLARHIRKMTDDNAACDRRIEHTPSPWCDLECAFLSLCRKPLRLDHVAANATMGMEIAIQRMTF